MHPDVLARFRRNQAFVGQFFEYVLMHGAMYGVASGKPKPPAGLTSPKFASPTKQYAPAEHAAGLKSPNPPPAIVFLAVRRLRHGFFSARSGLILTIVWIRPCCVKISVTFFLFMKTTSETTGRDRPDKPVLTKRLDRMFTSLSDVYRFTARFFREVFVPPYEWREIINQCYEIGFRSLPLITLTGFIIGIVFTNQSRPSLSDLGATALLPSLVAVAIVRALAPLVTALIAAGRVGSSIGAELGSMKVTEQIDAMEVSAVNPFKFLVVSRIVACTLMIPTLMMYTMLVALLGGYVNVHQNELTSSQSFFDQVFETISFLDVFSSVIKSFLFGFTIGVVGCYQGYNAAKGTEGVGKAANASVVASMFLIFIEELVALQVINAFRFA